MKILVTGAGGFIGGATMEMGRARGHDMVGCDIASNGKEGVVEGTVTDLALLTELAAGCDAIIHLATVHAGHLKKGMSHGEFYEINVTGADNVFQAALTHGVGRVVFASSLDIHCGSSWGNSGAVRFTPETPDIPNSLYSLSKQMVENMGHYYHRVHGVRFCALRYVYVHGSCQTPEVLNPFQLVSRVLLVEDCAAANLLGCESHRVHDDVLLLGPDNSFTNDDLVASVTDAEGVVERYWPGSCAELRAAGFSVAGAVWPVCDITRTRQVLGWVPEYGYEWLLEQVRGGLRWSG